MTENKKNIALEQQTIPSYIVYLLAWEQPIASAVTLVAINCIFW